MRGEWKQQNAKKESGRVGDEAGTGSGDEGEEGLAGKGTGGVEHGWNGARAFIRTMAFGITLAVAFAVMAAAPAFAGAEDLAGDLAQTLGPSDWGHPSRVIGVTEMGGDGLIISVWAAAMSTPESFRARVLHDVWLAMEAAFATLPGPLRVTVSVYYPGRQTANMQPLVVGHVRLSRDQYRALLEHESPPEELPYVADTALIYVPPVL